MATIIDQSETISGLQLLTNTIIRHDLHSPPGPVVVKTDGLTIGVGDTVNIQNHATLDANGLNVGALATVDVHGHGLFDITGPIQAGVLSNINIGHNGTVEIGSALSVNVLGNINFIGPDATYKLDPAAQGPLLSPASADNIIGFAATDTIDMVGLSGVNHAEWSQNLLQALLGFGEVHLFNAADQLVGSVGIRGSYQTSDFVVHGDGHHGTNIIHV